MPDAAKPHPPEQENISATSDSTDHLLLAIMKKILHDSGRIDGHALRELGLGSTRIAELSQSLIITR